MPLSPPLTSTSSALSAMQLMMLLWPSRFWRNLPFGSCHFLILSLPPDANVNCRHTHQIDGVRSVTATLVQPAAVSVRTCRGCDTIARMLFLWCVSVAMVLPAARSHRRMVWSMDPVMTCGSTGFVSTDATVDSCPPSTWMLCFVRMSQTCGATDVQ